MKKVQQKVWNSFKLEETIQQEKRTKKKKSLGIDKVQNYWLKYFTNLWPIWTDIINNMIQNPEDIPQWMAQG